MTSCSGRHDAIEHIGAARHAFDQIDRRADTHEVARLALRQTLRRQRERFEHE
jgi:hypothetical protein